MAKEKTTSNAVSHDSEVVIRNYPAALCREHEGKNGGIFHSLSFRFRDAWASVIIPSDSISSSREGKVDIALGKEDDVRIASIPEGDTYRPQPFFCSTIRNLISANKQEYLRSVAL